MKFHWKHGLMWVSVKLTYDGQDYNIDNCIIDTGATTSAIDIDLIPFNYNKPAIVRRLFGIGGGKQEVVVQSVEALQISDHVIQNVDIEFGDLNIDYGINGFIGTDLLSKFDVAINFSNLELPLKRLPLKT